MCPRDGTWSSSSSPYAPPEEEEIPEPEVEEDPEEVVELDLDSAMDTGEPAPGGHDWSVEYATSPCWRSTWEATQNPGVQWPEGVRLHLKQMLCDGRICVPEARVAQVVRDHHVSTGHVGVKRLVSDLQRRYAWPSTTRVFEVAQKVRRECVVCQACEHPNWSLRHPIVPTPVPAHVMSSVALDIFSLPEVEWRGETFDSMLLCVDRLTGWVLARPTAKVGLTAEKAAHLVMDGGWDTFGVPAIITSDQGPQFVGQWWRTLCARLGIRQGYSQAYRPQANGRAEVTGKTLIGLMRKLFVESHINWVEALPHVLRVYHDSPGESGFSPFELTFGRERFLAGPPAPLERECEGARQFCDRMEALSAQAAKELNAAHRMEAARVNAARKTPQTYRVGDWVWVLRPRSGTSESKMDTWWTGPVPVLRRTGEASYEVEIRPGVMHMVHTDRLKPFVTGEPVELFHFGATAKTGEEEETHVGEWNVADILDHRWVAGKPQFLTKWEGASPGEETWEPVGNFVHRYSYQLPRYCQKKGLSLNLVEYLSCQPTEA